MFLKLTSTNIYLHAWKVKHEQLAAACEYDASSSWNAMVYILTLNVMNMIITWSWM